MRGGQAESARGKARSEGERGGGGYPKGRGAAGRRKEKKRGRG